MFQIMVVLTRVDTDGDRPVVVKRASGLDADRLRREGERLVRVRHPGVVSLLRSGPSGDGWELCTAHGGRPVATVGPLTVPQVAGFAAGIASTLADLHDLGVVHGRLDATHALVGEHGRPVLCGFGDGQPPARPEDDVAALGALLVHLLGTDQTGEPIPERRWRGRRTWTGWDRRALLLLADQASAEPPTRRPTARRLAAAIAEAVPGTARVEDPSTSGPLSVGPTEPDGIERLRATAGADVAASPVPVRAASVAICLAGVLLMALGGSRLLGEDRGPEPPTVDPMATETPATASTEVRTAIPVASSGLAREGRRYRVGQPGDEVLVDDWDCDGEATPALLRPATGEVFVFPRWIEEGSTAVEPQARVVGAEALVSQAAGGGCPTLAVRTANGDLLPVIEPVR